MLCIVLLMYVNGGCGITLGFNSKYRSDVCVTALEISLDDFPLPSGSNSPNIEFDVGIVGCGVVPRKSAPPPGGLKEGEEGRNTGLNLCVGLLMRSLVSGCHCQHIDALSA
ncbi:hypothetical protein M405DRAFT_234775 [Rhizopogon salebrosus TDB-379]|nr:hypothetical protein M405DRAFT_234775 [Rhizopogon salebrosus TDB-379]